MTLTVFRLISATAVIVSGIVGQPVFSRSAAVQRAITAIEQSRAVAGVYYDERQTVRWTVGLYPDKSPRRFGFAHYVCDELRERGLVDSSTIVRVVNAPAVTIAKKNPREASLGSVQCINHQEIYP